jgi:electron transfer flavoprotein beta subunit
MRLIVAYKVLPDDQDIVVGVKRNLDYSIAKPTISTYDLNAIEAAVTIPGAEVVAVTVGDTSIDDSKTKKNALARGLNELYMIADDALKDADAFVTASVIAAVAEKIGGYDAIIFGDGSADNYAQQVNAQVAAILGIPSVNGVVNIVVEESGIVVERNLESIKETVELPAPCVIAVDPDIALPRICTMKEILAAGKKPVTEITLAEIGGAPAAALESLEILAPIPADRKLIVLDAAQDGALDEFADALAAAVR